MEDDAEVTQWVGKAQEVLAGFEERLWLSWAGRDLMPWLAQIVEAEDAERQRQEIAEAKSRAEEAARAQEAERERERQRLEAERRDTVAKKSAELLQQYQSKAITGEEFRGALDRLERSSDDGDDEDTSPKPVVGKRKEREGEETVGEARSKVSRL
jgi:septal ring factor EnvC (AmiA/AmiB activator)